MWGESFGVTRKKISDAERRNGTIGSFAPEKYRFTGYYFVPRKMYS